MIVLAVKLALAAVMSLAPAGAHTLAQPEHRYLCTEDMDCWDCSTMGNLICGPTTIPGD